MVSSPVGMFCLPKATFIQLGHVSGIILQNSDGGWPISGRYLEAQTFKTKLKELLLGVRLRNL